MSAAAVAAAASPPQLTTAASKQLWLDAWSDPLAQLKAFSPCVHACNLSGDGDWRLVVADAEKKLKVWKGTQKVSEQELLDVPVAMTSFIPDNATPKLPALAIASGPHIYIYRNLRPYYKFTLPPESIAAEEETVWSKLHAGELNLQVAEGTLVGLQEKGVALTARSLELLSLSDADAKSSLVQHSAGQPLVQQTVITCMDVIRQALDEPDAVSSLVVGTESGRVMVLNTAGTAVASNVWLGAVPALLATSGLLQAESRITVAARDGRLYTIRNGKLSSAVVQLEALPVGLVRQNKTILVGCMNDTIHSYNSKGRKAYTIYLPAPLVAMEGMDVQAARPAACLLAALANGELRVYNDRHLVATHTTASPVAGLFFGRYAREDNTLVSILRNGSLEIKMLPRSANLEVSRAPSGPPPEQDVPLPVPQKTKLYVEQTQRERQQAVDMHRVFQSDLCKLRLTTARAYVKVLTDGQGSTTFTSNSSLSMHVDVSGLGPRFKLHVAVRNDGGRALTNASILLKYDGLLYSVSRRLIPVPVLVPQLQYIYEIDVSCLDPSLGSDAIRIIMLQPGTAVPLLAATVKMPFCEADLEV